MHDSFHAFANEMIDYAGLFPPAELPLDTAIENYVKHRSQPESWMLARFIYPARRLDQLAAYANVIQSRGDPFRFSIILTGDEKPESFLEALDSDLKEIGGFRQRHGDRVRIEMIEARMPTRLLKGTDPQEIGVFLKGAAERIRGAGLQDAEVFFESAPPPQIWGATTQEIIQALSIVESPRLGYKIRCGGVTATAFPPVEQVARTLVLCREAGVPLKATAGLHHPIRHDDDSLRTKVHGFLNLFGAALLAHAHGLDEEKLQPILEDEASESFVFDEEGFAWRDLPIETAKIAELRGRAIRSFGSCSFDEPRNDLYQLGLLRKGETDNPGRSTS
ncbi:MAG: hypothetical protein GF346_05545 [Candidatus Eisenbacteria bacterium]|nr:hypothetical protein [Candidatus Latescibacterota bacterium]MBD3301892.1 hypothetical protein [Candidatus Eisenbacteria bacterium]